MKELKLAICDNMNGSQGHYAKWNVSNKERQMPLWSLSYVESKKEKFRDTEKRFMATRGSGWDWGGRINGWIKVVKKTKLKKLFVLMREPVIMVRILCYSNYRKYIEKYLVKVKDSYFNLRINYKQSI